MPYDSQNMGRGQGPSRNAGGRRGGAPSGGSRSRERVDLGGSYHGPRGTQQRSGSRGIRGRRGPSIQKGLGNGGYPLRSRSINFQGGRGRRSADRRMLILGALALVLIVLLVVGVSSCVKGCSNGSDQPAAEQNQIDSRVAAGVTDELTNRFKTELDRNEKLSQIAANANAYDDASLLELALDVPESIDFVANYPNAQKSGQAYSDAVSKGTAPELYDWDIRWGAVAYGEHPLAVSGSGPTAFSMAYMGLTGSADKTPADMAALASGQNFATGESGTDGAFFEAAAESLGLQVKSHESSSANLTEVLDAGTYLLVEAKAGTLTEAAHWVLLVTENADNTVVVYDPTSPEVSRRSWAPSTLASACDKFYSVTLKPTEGTSTDTSAQ